MFFIIQEEITQQTHISDLVRSCKMENIQIIEVNTSVGLETYVVIDNGNDNFTSMLKSTYDEIQANADKL